MTDWPKQKQVFVKTYSRKTGCYRPWNASSFSPIPVIDTYKDPELRHGRLQTPHNTPTSSETASTTSDSDSSLYSDGTQFLSLSGQQSISVAPDSYSSSDKNGNDVPTKKPDAPYHYKQKNEYSIIIEESDDMEKPIRNISVRCPVKHQPKEIPKSNRFGRKLPATKLMKDSLKHVTESDGFEEGSFSDLDFLTISSASELNTESSTENIFSSESDHLPAVTEDDEVDLPDIEVMRDAPPLTTYRKNAVKKGDLASSMKISAMKLYPPGGKVQTKLPYRRKARSRDRKNSTFKEEHFSAKPIQDVTFFQDISDISGGQTATSDALTADESESTLKATCEPCRSDEGTLKEVSLNIHKDPVTAAFRGTPPGYIRTPKKHNIKRNTVRKIPMLVESDSAKQVSFSKTNQESLYLPGSKIKDTSSSNQLPQLSPSMSILKKAVATWNLESPKDKKENHHGATTSTPLWKRRSKNKKPNMVDLSFGVSAVPLPSYDDLIVTSLPIKKLVKETTARKFDISTKHVPSCNDDEQLIVTSAPKEKPDKARESSTNKFEKSFEPLPSSNNDDLIVTSVPKEKPDKARASSTNKCGVSTGPPPSCNNDDLIITSLAINKKPLISKAPSTNKMSYESPKIGIDATPIKQLKRESPGSDIPVRPTKRRAMRLSSSSGSDVTTKPRQQTQKKRLEYKTVDVGPEICIFERLPDSLFMRIEQPSKLPFGTSVDIGYFKCVPIDSINMIPDSVFTGLKP